MALLEIFLFPLVLRLRAIIVPPPIIAQSNFFYKSLSITNNEMIQNSKSEPKKFSFSFFFIAGVRGEAGGVQLCGCWGAREGGQHPPPPGLHQGVLQRGALSHLRLPQPPRHRPATGVRGWSKFNRLCKLPAPCEPFHGRNFLQEPAPFLSSPNDCCKPLVYASLSTWQQRCNVYLKGTHEEARVHHWPPPSFAREIREIRPLDSITPHVELFYRSKLFLMFKGQGSLTYFFYRRKCSVIKCLSIYTTHTPPPPVPLDSTVPLNLKIFVFFFFIMSLIPFYSGSEGQMCKLLRQLFARVPACDAGGEWYGTSLKGRENSSRVFP